MSAAFEVSVTPPRIKNARKASVEREPTEVVLGLFSAKSIVTFEDIPITKTARRTLHVHNPTDDMLKVLVTKTINPIANAQLEWTSCEIPARSYKSMDIVWNPTVVWATREVIQLTDNRNFKKDVAIVLKSIDKTKNSKTTLKKSAVIKSSLAKMALKSPSPRQKLQRTRMTLTATNALSSNKMAVPSNDKIQPKRVLGTSNQSNMMPKGSQFTIPQIRIEKENMSPPNMSKMIDSMNFTPGAKGTSTNVEYLASMPTPNSHLDKNQSHCYQNLNETETIMKTPFKVNDQTTTLFSFQTPIDRSEVDNSRYFDTNIDSIQFAMQKTPAFNEETSFRFHHPSDTMNIAPHRKLNLDTSPNEKDNDISLGINRTHTVISPVESRKLSMIQEEQSKIEMCETYVEQCEHHLTYNVDDNVTTNNENLMRDVRLIATPLRKKYLSMKELNDTNSNLSLEQKILKINQGSMPNLHKLESVKSIENNRYFYQKDLQETEKQQNDKNDNGDNEEHNENLGDISTCSVQSTVSTMSVAFNEHEIQAASSRLNLNEIGQKKPTMSLAFTMDKPRSFDKNRMTSKKFLSTSSPTVNKMVERPELSQSTRDISSIAAKRSRPSVISYASGRSMSQSVLQKKRTREENLDSSKRSIGKMSPPKRPCIEDEPKLTKGQAFRTKTWGGTMPKKFRMPSVPPQRLLLKRPEQERVILYDPELHMKSFINPDPFAATTTLDPFLSATMYLDERAVDKHEIQFKKWLNALVTIPGELDENVNQPADVAKLFNEVQNKNCTLAPTKEMVSSSYLTKYRLASLRAAAIQLILSPEMHDGLSKLTVHIERKLIQIRQDRNLHLDVVLQRSILELLLKFNPLWLRIGLEAVFGESIPMHNNHDMVALSSFILNRLFRDRYLESKHPKVYAQGDAYAEHIKKHTLKKFLSLLYFLDVAKNKKIIKHNPCLFLKSSEYKETKEILLRFSSSLLGNIGDVQRDLKRIGIVLKHKQTFIDEFDYAFRNLAIDLRDGVRLTKVMEIILLRDDLTCQLRVPAISRTQRVHNVGVALKALEQANFQLTGKITPADIADGHREKTLSLLWQIIYQFRAPKFNAAATVIQLWWRKNWLNVCIRRRIRTKIERARNQAAAKIQATFRGYMERKYVRQYREERIKAAITIQRYVRRMIAIREFLIRFNCIVFIQRWYRNQKIAQFQRQQYLKLKHSCCIIQKWYRTILLARKIERLVPIARQVQEESKLTYKSAVLIQQKFRCYLQMKRTRSEFLQLKQATVNIQRRFRAQMEMRKQKQIYLEQIRQIVNVQRVFRANMQMKMHRESFLRLKASTIQIQSWYRACHKRNVQRNEYLQLKQSTLIIQRCLRAKIQRTKFLQMKQAIISIQRRFRAQMEMRKQRHIYCEQLQRIVSIQRLFRAKLQMRAERESFLRLKASTMRIQNWYRACCLRNTQQNQYLQLKKSAIIVQRRFRTKLMRSKFLEMKHATIIIQRRFRAQIEMRKQKQIFQEQIRQIVNLQRAFRAQIQMRVQRESFLRLKASTMRIQRWYRACCLRNSQQKQYLQLKKSTLTIQRHLRATLLMRQERSNYMLIRSSVVYIQRRYRDLIEARHQRVRYLMKKRSIIKIQRFFRGYMQMKRQRQDFLQLRTATITMQRQFRAQREMICARNQFQAQLAATKKIQTFYRSYVLMKYQRDEYMKLRSASLCLQQYVRAYLAAKRQRQQFLELRAATITIQHRFRAQREMIRVRNQFRMKLAAAKKIQTFYRSYVLMKRHHKQYAKLYAATICLQQHFRAYLAMKRQRQEFVQLRAATIAVQRRYRAQREMIRVRNQFQMKLAATKKIQTFYRSYMLMKRQHKEYKTLYSATICLQQHVRAYLAMKWQRQEFLQLYTATVTIQRRFRAQREMIRVRNQFQTKLIATIKIQQFYRSYVVMRRQRDQYTKLRAATVCLQQCYRALLLMRAQRIQYLNLQYYVICMQRRYRAKMAMKTIHAQYKLLRCLVICIQRKFRANLAMRRDQANFLRLKTATIFIQRTYRSKLNTRYEMERFKCLQKVAIGLQTHVRGFLARQRFKALMTPELIEKRKQIKAAKKIQSFWRGYRVRKSSSRILRAISEKAKYLQKHAQYKNTVGQRVKGIVYYLRTKFNVKDAYAILKELEIISLNIPHILIADSEFLASFCYGIMSQAIRSEVDKIIIGLCCRILLNLARYKPTQQNVFQIHHFETVAQILYRWCDKDCDIFNVLCTLLYVFIQCPTINQQMRDFMITKEAIFLLREAKKLVARKERMRSITPPVWMPVLTPKEKRTLPMLETNFGIRSPKNYMFNCSVFGLDTILKLMNIEI